MATCKYPKCNKELIGKEKFICTSCLDKIKEGRAMKAAKFTGGALIVLTLKVVVDVVSEPVNAAVKGYARRRL